MSQAPRVSREGTKTCTKCGVTKPLSNYNRDAKKTSGYRSHCKSCTSTGYRQWSVSGERGRVSKLRSRFGMSVEDYDRILAAQNNGCAICGKSPSENGKRLSIDHNHDTGKVRGLLCQPCNTGIGLLNDSPSQLRLALRYLEERGHYGRN